MSKLLAFALPVVLLIGGVYWIGTEFDRKAQRIRAETEAASRALQIAAERETERLRPIIEAEAKETHRQLQFILDYAERHPEKTQEILDRLDGKIPSRQ